MSIQDQAGSPHSADIRSAEERPTLFSDQEMAAFDPVKQKRKRASPVEQLFRCQSCPSEQAHKFTVEGSSHKGQKIDLYLCDQCACVAWVLPLFNTSEEYTEQIRKAKRKRKKAAQSC